MDVLPVQIIRITSGIVNVPRPVKVVHLGGPDVAAARRRRGAVDDLFRGRLEPVNRRGARNLHVGPRRRHEVEVTPRVDEKRVAAARAADRVGEGRGRAQEDAQRAPEDG